MKRYCKNIVGNLFSRARGVHFLLGCVTLAWSHALGEWGSIIVVFLFMAYGVKRMSFIRQEVKNDR